jgi:serine/threonine protein kinase
LQENTVEALRDAVDTANELLHGKLNDSIPADLSEAVVRAQKQRETIMQSALDQLKFSIDLEELSLVRQALEVAKTMMPPPPGAGFHEGYTVGAEIGDGAFAKVYKCTRKADGAEFAAKVIALKGLTPKEELQIIQEAENLRKLKHPNIVELVDFFKEDESFYLVTDLMNGGELCDKLLENVYYEEDDAREVVRQLAATIAYCHSQRIVHRDIKPQNLILVNNESMTDFKLVDFGFSMHMETQYKLKGAQQDPVRGDFAKSYKRSSRVGANMLPSPDDLLPPPPPPSFDEDMPPPPAPDDDMPPPPPADFDMPPPPPLGTPGPPAPQKEDASAPAAGPPVAGTRQSIMPTGMEKRMQSFVGTPGYMAPEIYSARDKQSEAYDKSVDVWAIGVLTYTLLSGVPPFIDDNAKLIEKRVKTGKLEFTPTYLWEDVSASAKDIIKRMLSPDPEARMTAEQLLKHPWLSSSKFTQATLRKLELAHSFWNASFDQNRITQNLASKIARGTELEGILVREQKLLKRLRAKMRIAKGQARNFEDADDGSDTETEDEDEGLSVKFARKSTEPAMMGRADKIRALSDRDVFSATDRHDETGGLSAAAELKSREEAEVKFKLHKRSARKGTAADGSKQVWPLSDWLVTVSKPPISIVDEEEVAAKDFLAALIAVLEKLGQLKLRRIHEQGEAAKQGRVAPTELEHIVHEGLALQERMQAESQILDLLRDGMTHHDLGCLTDALQAVHQTNLSRHPQVEAATALCERLKKECEYEEVLLGGYLWKLPFGDSIDLEAVAKIRRKMSQNRLKGIGNKQKYEAPKLSFKRRWFQIEGGNLKYYAKEEDAGNINQELGSVPLHHVADMEMPAPGQIRELHHTKLGFDVDLPDLNLFLQSFGTTTGVLIPIELHSQSGGEDNGRVYTISCESTEQCRNWVAGLRRAVNAAKVMQTGCGSLEAQLGWQVKLQSAARGAALRHRWVRMEGNLAKQGHVMKTWKKRHFMLQGGPRPRITYHVKKYGPAKGVVMLGSVKSCEVSEQKELHKGGQFYFKLVVARSKQAAEADGTAGAVGTALAGGASKSKKMLGRFMSRARSASKGSQGTKEKEVLKDLTEDDTTHGDTTEESVLRKKSVVAGGAEAGDLVNEILMRVDDKVAMEQWVNALNAAWVTEEGETALTQAIRKGDAKMVRKMLLAGADPMQRYPGMTDSADVKAIDKMILRPPLHIAIMEQQAECAKVGCSTTVLLICSIIGVALLGGLLWSAIYIPQKLYSHCIFSFHSRYCSTRGPVLTMCPVRMG